MLRFVSPEEIAELRAEVERLRTWQPIETAPTDGTIIILRGLWDERGTLPMLAVAGLYDQRLGWWMRDNQGCGFTVSCSPTHWMPLQETKNDPR